MFTMKQPHQGKSDRTGPGAERPRMLGAWCLVGVILSLFATAVRAESKGDGYNPKLAVGMYRWVQDRRSKGTTMWDDLDAVLGEVRAAGFTYVEGFLQDFYGSDERAERTRRLLAKNKVKLAGLYTGGKLYEEQAGRKAIASIVEMARRAKGQGDLFIDINPNPLPGGKKKSDAQLATQARMLDELGRKLKALGMELVVHQHAPEIHHGAREHRYNIKHTDPKLVGFCIDTHWFYRGGADVMELTRATGKRIKAVHLRNSKGGVWTESFGPGDIDYKAVADYLREIGFDGWLSLELAVEKGTKVTQGIVENHRQGREYIEKVFLGGGH